MELSERRKWYLGFAIVILALVGFMISIHASHFWIIIFLVSLAAVAAYDLIQTKHTLLRNFPILGHIRYIFEFFRPEIQQYFIADDKSEKPFDRDTRTVVYRRSKGINDTTSFGTDKDVYAVGYEWIAHSLTPKDPLDVENRVFIGGPDCKHPYSASRLNISAMSYGALSKNALIAANKGAALGKFYQNTGEGGLTPYHDNGGDVVFQIGTGYFCVRNKDTGEFDEQKFKERVQPSFIKMIEIKLSQGAKPAHGGVLPAAKITAEIAEIRGCNFGKDVLSPPSHSAFEGPKGLCFFIQKLRELSDGKPIGFKLCIGRHDEFISICKAMVKYKIYPDFITVDGSEGGTGAAPMEYADSVGAPLNEALHFVNNILIGFGLRDKIKLIASGKVATGFDMVQKIALGADICNSARAMMMALGCIQSRQCNNNTCPVGVATQNPKLYKNLDIEDKKVRINNFHDATLHSFREIIGAMGFKYPSEITPDLIFRRTSIGCVKSYEEIYPTILKDSLLSEETVPEAYKDVWEKAVVEN